MGYLVLNISLCWFGVYFALRLAKFLHRCAVFPGRFRTGGSPQPHCRPISCDRCDFIRSVLLRCIWIVSMALFIFPRVPHFFCDLTSPWLVWRQALDWRLIGRFVPASCSVLKSYFSYMSPRRSNTGADSLCSPPDPVAVLSSACDTHLRNVAL